MHVAVSVNMDQDNCLAIQEPKRHQPLFAVIFARVFAGDGALRRNRRRPGGAPRHPRGSVCEASRTVRASDASTRRTAECGLDQSAETERRNWRSTVITQWSV